MSIFPRQLQLRPSTSAKILLAIIIATLYFYFPLHAARPLSSFNTFSSLEGLRESTHADLITIYETVRNGEIERKGFNAVTAANALRTPTSFKNGDYTLSPSLEHYTERLQSFVNTHLAGSRAHLALDEAVARVSRRTGPLPVEFPRNIFSTDKIGPHALGNLFNLWGMLLPIPLSTELLQHLNLGEWAEPARDGGKWDVIIADDQLMDDLVSEWLGQRVSYGHEGEGDWPRRWGKMKFGVLRADLFRYLALLFEGGVYADSDTAPLAHPYVWGLGAEPISHPDLDLISRLLRQDSTIHQRNSLRLGASRNSSWEPPYPSVHRLIRSPIVNDLSPDIPSILSPDINVVVAIEWDSSFSFNLWRWPQWNIHRLKRSWRNCCGGRSLQFSQYAFAAKPHHPILLDTIATVAELIDEGAMESLAALDITGPGPFSDAIFRYLLVQYGVTPNQLRDIKGPVRVGDVLVLQEEAMLGSQWAVKTLFKHVRRVVPGLFNVVDACLRDKKLRADPWYWKHGYRSWRSGGNMVLFHGLSGRWKGQGWNT